MWVAFKQFIHDIADWLEALGFIAGIVTVIKVFLINRDVKKIQVKHLYQVRVDDHLRDLKNTSKVISNHLPTFKANQREIKIELSNCIENCKSLRKKISKEELTNLTPLINNMTRFRDNKTNINTSTNLFKKLIGHRPITEQEIDIIYTQITSLITELEHHNKDIKKSIK